MRKFLFWLTCFVTIFLSSCATKPTTETWLTKETKVNLPKPDLNQPYHCQQLLTFKYNGQENSLITLVNAESNTLTAVGLSTLGIRLFKIEYRDNVITTEQNIFIKELPPASQILSDIMLSVWPIQKWQTVLPKGWQLIDNDLHRKLINDKQETIIDITYQQQPSMQIRKPIYLKHNVFNYQITIQNME